MSNILKNAKEHFKNKLNGELHKVAVEEWKQDVFYKGTYSFATESKIMQLQQEGKVAEALVESILQKALTPEGKRMFTEFDKQTLMHDVDPAVLIKIASAINKATTEYRTVDEVAKN